MISIKDKKIFINNTPLIIMCGEIHYYRLKKSQWQTVIDELVACGLNTIATYVPWLCHEFDEGIIDINGSTNECLDLISFIELVKKNNLYLIVRPGPFIMAEMKNEGIPHWVYKKHPELTSLTWDNGKATSKTIDYLNPDFLKLVKNWYKHVMTLFAENLITNGGHIIGVQLDNEVGMLSWVTNCPDLSDFNVLQLKDWILNKYGEESSDRYGFNLNDESACFDVFRSPSEAISLKYHKDLGHFMRYRFKEYIAKLKSFANEFGVTGIPMIVNIHGSGGSRSFGYPMGISQLFESYNYSDEFLSGSDFYIGNIGIGNFQDVY
jgi:beta-galactosidase